MHLGRGVDGAFDFLTSLSLPSLHRLALQISMGDSKYIMSSFFVASPNLQSFRLSGSPSKPFKESTANWRDFPDEHSLLLSWLVDALPLSLLFLEYAPTNSWNHRSRQPASAPEPALKPFVIALSHNRTLPLLRKIILKRLASEIYVDELRTICQARGVGLEIPGVMSQIRHGRGAWSPEWALSFGSTI